MSVFLQRDPALLLVKWRGPFLRVGDRLRDMWAMAWTECSENLPRESPDLEPYPLCPLYLTPSFLWITAGMWAVLRWSCTFKSLLHPWVNVLVCNPSCCHGNQGCVSTWCPSSGNGCLVAAAAGGVLMAQGIRGMEALGWGNCQVLCSCPPGSLMQECTLTFSLPRCQTCLPGTIPNLRGGASARWGRGGRC